MIGPVRAGAAVLVAAAVTLTGCGAPAAPGVQSTTTAPASGTSDFTDPARWPTLPALTDRRPLSTEDIAAALPGGAPWNEAQVALVAPLWQPPWCEERDGPPRVLEGIEAPRDDQPSFWAGGDPGAASNRFLEVVAVRWDPAREAGAAAARRWGEALRTSAADCPDAVVVDAPGIPGEAPVLTVTAQDSGTWAVQAATTGGPTGLRLRTWVAAASAEEAAAAVAPLVTTAVGRLESADDLAGHLSDRPASRPQITAEHLVADTHGGQPAEPARAPAPASVEEVSAGWCPTAAAVDAVPPEQAWTTAWTKPGEQVPFTTSSVEETVLRFTGVGDEAGVDAARTHVEALRGGARACVDAGGDGGVLVDSGDLSEAGYGTDVMITAVDQEDGSWSMTVAARDGVTVLVLRSMGTGPRDLIEPVAVGQLAEAWRRVHDADRAPGATASLS